MSKRSSRPNKTFIKPHKIKELGIFIKLNPNYM